MSELIASLPYQEVDEKERADLSYMYQEEKMARDVYLTLKEHWNRLIFQNIANSEQRHMDAIKMLFDKYSLPLPILDDTVGYFTNAEIQNLYLELVAAGKVSLENALKVGATIEDRDIFDLKEALYRTDNSDIKTVYQNLMKGSRNHLRAFARQLSILSISYEAQYLSQEEVDAIINSPMERGVVDENGEPFFGDIDW
ncbi:MAG: DUF2202 domain-containing protein [Candidatus Aminicenantes bacterium]|nr:DUF2202 domain-containing protein [Candidatus Aminicenantes bacterium]